MASFSTVQPTWRQALIDAMLGALSTVPAAKLVLNGMIHLLKATINFNPQTPIASFTALEANFSGYAAIALPALVGPLNGSVNRREMFANAIFVATSPLVTANNIFGYWIDQNAGADWVMAELFPAPMPVAAPGDFVELDLLLPLAEVLTA